MVDSIGSALKAEVIPGKAEILQGFFKTGPGEYGEGDIFLGVPVPQQRKVAKKFLKTVTYSDLTQLLESEVHEERLTALFVLVEKYKRARKPEQLPLRTEINQFYLEHLHGVNNWDLVDSSAPYILGPYTLETGVPDSLYRLASSKDLWLERIAMMACFAHIKAGSFDLALELARGFRDHDHDLMHKAVGWMLREIGNRALDVEEDFLKLHYKQMPRTMLRYAIEKFPEKKRKRYLRGEI
jgi:3-methyladenine DNA glycosylase AlkD